MPATASTISRRPSVVTATAIIAATEVFEPFYRICSARNPDTGGVGLSLSVTRSIVWEHGGHISLATRKGGGLIVRVELPVITGASSWEHEAMSSKG